MLGALVAVVPQSTTPALFPLRLLAVFYTDLFRGVPTILVVFMLGLRDPGPEPPGRHQRPCSGWGLVALVLSYGAYVAEVIRAGIDSIHPSQIASANALGLSHCQAMRYVVVPQGVRRVIPPLLNDFISLQKDTALLSGPPASSTPSSRRRTTRTTSSTSRRTPWWPWYFIVLTIPLARFTDHLRHRAMRTRAAGAR